MDERSGQAPPRTLGLVCGNAAVHRYHNRTNPSRDRFLVAVDYADSSMLFAAEIFSSDVETRDVRVGEV